MKKDHPGYDKSMWKGAPPESFSKVRRLRKNMTPAENLLWDRLKNNQFGYKFRRQHPVHSFIADFYCHHFKLVIEIDGKYHNDEMQKEKDREREELLKFQELHIIRFTNEEVIADIEKVLNSISTKMKELED